MPAVAAASDPFLFDADRLQTLASLPIVRRGLAYFKENRVTELGWNESRLWARVDGTRPGGYQVELYLDEDGELSIDCDCPFDWEPACKHALATLLAYAARQPVSELEERGAASAALQARVQRGRSEVEVQHIEGDPWLGTWEARSLSSAADGRPAWRVELRSVSERINSCNCPDFATNRLGTCKHIEAVRHRLRRRAPKKFERLAQYGPPASIAHLEWGVPGAPRIRLRRAAAGAPPWLDEHFDADGFLRGELPEALERVRRAPGAAHELVITPDVGDHLRRLEEEARHRVRAAELAGRIRASGGVLPGVAARLYPYQVEGVAFLAAAGRALLADDMGLGKTLQAIAAAAVLREHDGVCRALVVCPASLKHQWQREVKRFTGVEAAVVHGPPAARAALYRQRAPFTMVNYELVLRDAEVIQAELAPDLLILDEAQRIKNWRTRTAAAVKTLDTPFAFVLTGTPLENRLEDLYSLMQVVDSRVLGPLWRYLLDYHITDERGRVLGYRNLARLRRRLEPVMLRRDRTIVRDQLPERIDTQLDVELDRRQRTLHDEAMACAGQFAKIAEKRPLTPSEEHRLMAALQAARMACNAAGLVDGETVGSPKLDELASLLEELCVDGGRKIVVFSQWERMTRMAGEVARNLGLGVVRLHGSVPTSQRAELIDRFRDDPSVQVFLSTDAGAVGLNLQTASVLINLDLPWNPAVLEQRIARVHRLGQVEPVQVVLMVARGSYEARIAGLIAAKRDLFRNVVTEDASEDVIGVSKKMVEVALATLSENGAGGQVEAEDSFESDTGAPAADGGANQEAAADSAGTAPATSIAAPDSTAPPADADESLAPILASLQNALGDRIERVVAYGGNLVVVVDTLESVAESAAQPFAADVPVAVVDARSWAALARLGTSSPVAGARVLVERRESGGAAGGGLAKQKLAAAEALARGGHHQEALQLAVAAMLHAVSAAAGHPRAPSHDRAAVWLHSEVVPAGVASADQVASIGRGLALAAAGEIPPELSAAVFADAEKLVNELV